MAASAEVGGERTGTVGQVLDSSNAVFGCREGFESECDMKHLIPQREERSVPQSDCRSNECPGGLQFVVNSGVGQLQEVLSQSLPRPADAGQYGA